MRTLFFLVILASLAWSGYWYVGAEAQSRGFQAWLDQQRARGWVAEASAIEVAGFPNRFDTEIRDLNLADPNSAWAWSAPVFQILALSYSPNHVIADWPNRQSIASPMGRIEVFSQQMRGSVRLAPNTSLALQETRIDLQDVRLESTNGWEAALSEGFLAIREAPEGNAPPHAYDVALTASALDFPEPLLRRIDPAGLAPKSMQNATIRLTPVFDAPWDRHAVEDGPPALVTLNIGNVSGAWGEMEMTVTGRLDADPAGYADGDLNLIAQNWREMLDIAERSGALPGALRTVLEGVLGGAAQVTGQTNRLDITISFSRGRPSVAGIPIPGGERLRLNRGVRGTG